MWQLNQRLNVGAGGLYCQGRALRTLAGLDADGPERASDLGQMEHECVVLMDGDRAKELSEMRADGKKHHVIGPTVVGQRYVTAKDTTRAILRDLNKQFFVCDGKQTNSGMMCCAFIAHYRKSDRMPITHIGKSKGIVAMLASMLEEAHMKHKEIKQAMGINYTNHFTCQILECDEPKPDIGPPVHLMAERTLGTGKATSRNFSQVCYQRQEKSEGDLEAMLHSHLWCEFGASTGHYHHG